MSSIKKSTSRASRCNSESICTAPSAAPACAFGGGAAFTGIGFEYPHAKAISGANAPENKIEKKLRNAKEILFKIFPFYLADINRITRCTVYMCRDEIPKPRVPS